MSNSNTSYNTVILIYSTVIQSQNCLNIILNTIRVHLACHPKLSCQK